MIDAPKAPFECLPPRLRAVAEKVLEECLACPGTWLLAEDIFPFEDGCFDERAAYARREVRRLAAVGILEKHGLHVKLCWTGWHFRWPHEASDPAM